MTGDDADDPGSPPPAPKSPAELHFHLALAAVYLPLISLPLTWALAAYDWFRPSRAPGHWLWTRRLTLLLVADVLVVVAGYELLQVMEEGGLAAAESRGVQKARIGVRFDPEAAPTARIHTVQPGSPANRAGLRKGDEILAVNGVLVDAVDDVRGRIGGGEPGTEWTLSVGRNDAAREVKVTSEAPSLPGGGLFKPFEDGQTGEMAYPPMLELGSVVLVAFIAWAFTRRRSIRTFPVWGGFLVALLGAYAALPVVVLALDAVFGGRTVGGLLLAMLAMMALLLAFSWIVTRRLPAPPAPDADLTPLRGLMQSVFYVLTGFPRIGIVLAALNWVVFDGGGGGDHEVEFLAQLPLGVVGTAMLVASVVFLGPVAEEALFRGFLVPRLAANLGDRLAIWLSAILFSLLHLQYGVFTPITLFYGLIFAWARLRTGSVVVPIILHVLINGFVMAVFLSS